jgi:hypothetical protein
MRGLPFESGQIKEDGSVCGAGLSGFSDGKRGKFLRGKQWPSSTGLSINDIDLMTRTIYGEARGEPYIGQVAVVAVILNRMKNDGFPTPCQGSSFSRGHHVRCGRPDLADPERNSPQGGDGCGERVGSVGWFPVLFQSGDGYVQMIWNRRRKRKSANTFFVNEWHHENM